jgi:putative transcriptional regulator
MKPLFKNKIRVYRAQFNLSQEDLAKRVGVRRETIGNLESGKYNPSLLLAMDIAAVFNVNVEDIFQKFTEETEDNHG